MGLFQKIRQILSPDGQPSGQNTESLGNLSTAAMPISGKQLNLSADDRQSRVASLTPREHQLFLLLLQGFTLKESARQLNVKYSTANTHMTGIYKKLTVNSRAELIINYRDIAGSNSCD